MKYEIGSNCKSYSTFFKIAKHFPAKYLPITAYSAHVIKQRAENMSQIAYNRYFRKVLIMMT